MYDRGVQILGQKNIISNYKQVANAVSEGVIKNARDLLRSTLRLPSDVFEQSYEIPTNNKS